MMIFKKHNVIILLIVLSGALLLCGHFALAQAGLGLAEVEEEIALGKEDIRIIIARIIRVFLGLLGIIIVGLIVYGGFVWLTAAGDPKKIVKAKMILVNAVIGLIIVLASFAISQFILSSLIEATTKPEEAPVYIPPRPIAPPGNGP